jgi:AraC family transcriptional regulator of adaptative response/methylated-DNA-[protein]-cysteine methyltransferase
MSPTELRRGGEGLEIGVTVRPCSLGQVLIAATARGVCAVFFGDSAGPLRRDLRRRFPGARVRDGEGTDLPALADRIVELVNTGRARPDIPLDLIGTAFQQKVWRALREIRPGSTTTYRELARHIGAPRAVRAVGTACGANPVSLAVPCHRVLRSDGGLGGYAWGLERKRTLLARERARSSK